MRLNQGHQISAQAFPFHSHKYSESILKKKSCYLQGPTKSTPSCSLKRKVMIFIEDSSRTHLMYSPASLLPWLPTALEPGPRLSRNSLLGLPPFFPRLFSPLAWKNNAIMRNNFPQITHLPSAPAVPKYFPPDEC